MIQHELSPAPEHWAITRWGHGIHGLINYRARNAKIGCMVFGTVGQGVRRNEACLDLSHPALIREEHRIFGLELS